MYELYVSNINYQITWFEQQSDTLVSAISLQTITAYVQTNRDNNTRKLQ